MTTTRTPAILVGCGAADALGMPFEKLKEEVHPDLATWDGKYRDGTFHKPPKGMPTDDTEMAVCLATSLIERQTFDVEDIAQHYLRWAQGTPHGMGGSTKSAMQRLAEGVSCHESGVTFKSPHEVGSAPAMRAAPLGAFFADSSDIDLFKACTADAYITHADPEAVASSLAVAIAVRAALCNNPIQLVAVQIVSSLRFFLKPTLVEAALSRISCALHPETLLNEFGRRGNAWQITATAIHCALWAKNYREGVIAAIKLGGDTDTRAAIAGAILGARFGLEGIPEEYKEGLIGFEHLRTLDQALNKSNERRR